MLHMYELPALLHALQERAQLGRIQATFFEHSPRRVQATQSRCRSAQTPSALLLLLGAEDFGFDFGDGGLVPGGEPPNTASTHYAN